MIRALEVYDSFNPDRLLEVRFVFYTELPQSFFDGSAKQGGYSLTGRTFRSSYLLLRRCLLKDKGVYTRKTFAR